jgi:FAD:protein FMN transferase
MRLMTRRRFIAITGLFAGATLAGRAVRGESGEQLIRWDGSVLGAVSSLELYHADRSAAERLIEECLAEVGRLERIFSLYRPDSALARLNRDGRLDDPPPELTAVLAQSLHFSEISGGAFDVTVQPLWTLYADHFARPDADPAGPPDAAIEAAKAFVDYRQVQVSVNRLALAKPGMGLTFNGIAQGYITDSVVALLRRRGVDKVLAQLDAYRSSGRHPDGRSWHVGIGNPQAPDTALEVIELSDKALASSGGYGTTFDDAGRFHHLFDPATGRPSFAWAGTNVVADSAMVADGLSTTLAVSHPDRAADLLRAGGGEAAYLIDDGNRMTTLQA